jgi:serine phosphatase RsbU (regulator of sigma subunit)
VATAAAEPAVSSAAGPAEATSATPLGGARAWPHWLAVGVLVIGLLVTAGLVLLTRTLYDHNEKRLLDLRVRELAAVLQSAQPRTQTPLASASALADATGGDVGKFKQFIRPYVGSGPLYPFVTVSLWDAHAPARGPEAVVGQRPALQASSAYGRAFLARVARTPRLALIGLTPPKLMRIGFAYTTPAFGGRFFAYGESQLPADRRSRLQSNTAFSDLDYALYLGNNEQAENLLVTSLSQLPIRGRRARTTVPFGDTVLTVVVSAHQSLAGALPQQLPLIIAVVGVALTLGGGALTVGLTRRRRAAEDLARRLEGALGENQRLYAEQRTIAQTLQHALLPEELPRIPGVEASARYEPGERGVDVGGDWYDMVPLGGRRLLVVVGDVSGRGVRAAATMASLRFAILAYAAQNDPPARILGKLSHILSVADSGHMATVLCALIDIDAGEITVASAGHLPALIVSDSGGAYVEPKVGVPVGVQAGAEYISTTIPLPGSATFLAFTDGLVERRGENLDRGLERLRRTAVNEGQAGLGELLGRLVDQVRPVPSEDDTAIVGVRWKA